MQIICYELFGICFYFPEQLFNFRRLEIAILEALLIKEQWMKINRQTEDFNNTLKIF